MNKMGVTMQEGKLIIDTNKAKEFFWTLQKNLDGIDKELQEGNLTAMKPAGIEVTQEKMTIDLNKSRSFFDSWGKKMEAFAKEFDTSWAEILGVLDAFQMQLKNYVLTELVDGIEEENYEETQEENGLINL